MALQSTLQEPAGGGQSATVDSAGATPAALWVLTQLHSDDIELDVVASLWEAHKLVWIHLIQKP